MPKRIEISTGQKYNQLTFIERIIAPEGRHLAAWGLFRCDCGKEVKNIISNVKNSYVKSCGHSQPYTIKEKTGDKFNHLTFIKRTFTKEHRIFGIFQCDCGKEIEVAITHVRRERVKSCGCKHLWKQLPIGEASFNAYYRLYKKTSRIRKIDFNLTKEQFRKITSQCCHYCGAKPSADDKERTTYNGMYFRNGIDRFINNKPYITENCVPCCKVCNLLKHKLPVEKFISQIDKIYHHTNGLNTVSPAVTQYH